MEIELVRGYDSGESTIGILSTEGNYYFTLEDAHHDVKIHGKTRIPSGHYKILERKVMSEMTKYYRKKYPWFVWHLELQDVPDFKYVYMHIGNYPKNTDGCVLVGSSLNINDKDFVGGSTVAFKSFYKLIYKELKKGNDVTINIR